MPKLYNRQKLAQEMLHKSEQERNTPNQLQQYIMDVLQGKEAQRGSERMRDLTARSINDPKAREEMLNEMLAGAIPGGGLLGTIGKKVGGKVAKSALEWADDVIAKHKEARNKLIKELGYTPEEVVRAVGKKRMLEIWPEKAAPRAFGKQAPYEKPLTSNKTLEEMMKTENLPMMLKKQAY